MKSRNLFLLNTIAFLAVVLVNYLSNALPLNGRNTGELSDDFPNLFVPAGLTFAIWGVIYSLLAVWIGNQVRALFNEGVAAKIQPHVERIGWWFALSCVFNIAWLFAWHWSFLPLSLVLMLGILGSLVKINSLTNSGLSKTSGFEKNIGHIVFGIYQGWITIAMIANVTALLVTLGWQGGGLAPEVWTIIMMVIGTGLAIYMVASRNIWFHGLAVAWALLGIFIKRNALGDADSVKYTALGLMGVLVIVMIIRLKKWLQY